MPSTDLDQPHDLFREQIRYARGLAIGIGAFILLVAIIARVMPLLLLFVFPIGFPLVFAAVCVTLYLTGLGVVRAFGEGLSPAKRLGLAFAAPAGTVLPLLAAPALSLAVTYTAFFIRLPAYREIIANGGRAPIGSTLEFQVHGDRIAFEPQGLLNNWRGTIYDPTGEVMLAVGRNADGKFRAPEHITQIFGGDLVRCTHLLGNYYDCSFT